MHLIERFTRTGPETLLYEFTVTDPTTWTRPWSAAVPMLKTDEGVYEYACHEGNRSLETMLENARAAEKAPGGARRSRSRRRGYQPTGRRHANTFISGLSGFGRHYFHFRPRRDPRPGPSCIQLGIRFGQAGEPRGSGQQVGVGQSARVDSRRRHTSGRQSGNLDDRNRQPERAVAPRASTRAWCRSAP